MSSIPSHKDRLHADLSPSGAHRWMNCPGSVEAEKGVPDIGSVYAAEGTAAHELGERCLRHGYDPKIFIGETINGFTVDCEMADAVGVYTTLVNSISGACLIEARLSLKRWVPPDSFGTADAVVVDGSHLHVIDLKYGKIGVDAYHNMQGIMYALGAYDLVSCWSGIERVSIYICQPRTRYSPDIWTVSVEELLAWGDKVKAAAKRIADGDKSRSPSASTCRWCRARPRCKAAAQAAMETARIGFEDMEDGSAPEKMLSEDDLTWEETALVLGNIDMLTGWAKSVKDHALKSALEGVKVPGYKLVSGRPGNRSWGVDQKEFFRYAMGLGYEEDALTIKKLVSPTQLEKAAGKVKFAEEFGDLVTRSAPKPALVVESDGRPALVIDRAAGFE